MEKRKLKQLFDAMTRSEKIGQLIQVSPNYLENSLSEHVTGPMQHIAISDEERFAIGSTLNLQDKEEAYAIQKRYLENSRLKIPLLLMADVIHGYRTIFPIPLAIGSSWNPKLAEEIASLSALEASSEGIHVTFSPMVDLVRDPRWGRVLESTGEDSYLNCLYARAFVKGYQGEGLLSEQTEKIVACVKHFIGYGLSEGGRDYNRVDLSELELYQNHLPAYRAALDAGAHMIMTAFNTVYGIPATANKKLLQGILRDELGFDGVLISDWDAIGELIQNGVAANQEEASRKAIEASVDIDMMAFSYHQTLASLADEDAQISEKIEQAAWRVLTLKNDLGLFENPYRGFKKEEESNRQEIRSKARQLASKTMVLLENKNQTLPIGRGNKIGVVGPFADNHDLLGAWSMRGDKTTAITLAQGIASYSPDLQIASTRDTKEISLNEWEAIKKVFQVSDLLIVALGEASEESGEGASKADITLASSQIELLKKAKKTGKKVVTVLFNGRPLDLREVQEHSDAVLEAWYPGVEAGNAVADILFGKTNPSGKLSMTFPYVNGQIPVYYNQIRTGRPVSEKTKNYQYVSRYLDIPNTPLYPFGYGKSYATFIISDIQQSSKTMTENGEIIFSGDIRNTSDYQGQETIQLYIHDLVAEVVRPIKELKAFEQITVGPHTKENFSFRLTIEDLKYIHSDLVNSADKGMFDVFIGTDSTAKRVGSFKLIEGG